MRADDASFYIRTDAAASLKEGRPLTDEPETMRRDEPEWVREMRAKGYPVRVGTGTRGLPYFPEASFHDFDHPRTGIGRRLADLAQNLWRHAGSLSRIVHR